MQDYEIKSKEVLERSVCVFHLFSFMQGLSREWEYAVITLK